MDVLKLFDLLWRRRRAVIPTALLVAVGLGYVYTSAPSIYRATGSIVLLTPQQPELGPGVTAPKGVENPYLRVGEPSVVLDIIGRRMRSPNADVEMRKRGLVGTLAIGANLAFYHGPIFDISAEAPTAAAAINDVHIAFDEVRRQLVAIQTDQGTDPAFSITASDVVEPEGASHVLSGTLRRVIAAGVAGVLLILLVAAVAEAREQRRDRQRSPRSGMPEPSDAPPTVETAHLAANGVDRTAVPEPLPPGPTTRRRRTATNPASQPNP